MCKRFWHTPKISQKFVGEWKFGLYCYGQDENRTGYHPALVHLFRGIVFQGTWQRKFEMFQNSRKASRGAQNALAGNMRPAGRVFDTPDVQPLRVIVTYRVGFYFHGSNPLFPLQWS